MNWPKLFQLKLLMKHADRHKSVMETAAKPPVDSPLPRLHGFSSQPPRLEREEMEAHGIPEGYTYRGLTRAAGKLLVSEH